MPLRIRRKNLQKLFPWKTVIVSVVLLAGGLGVWFYPAPGVDVVAGKANLEADRWQAVYWKKPIPPQGEAPPNHLEPTRGLQPENCAVCHPDQFKGWKASLHGKAMGPGVVGQFHSMSFGGEASCLNCHAPMAEQWKYLLNDGKWVANKSYNPALKNQGITCAACHLRRHKRHGPPLRKNRPSISQAVHGEPERTPFFEASEFCKGCHQHPSTSLLVNGKTVENTYREWLNSPYPEQGVTCQKCHMPDRRHLWKGIHDREMTLSGVTITATIQPRQPEVGSKVTATLTLRNTGTGHAFPTYTTPAVYLKAALLDDKNRIIPGGFLEEKILQRRLNMSTSPWTEFFDTRVLPGDAATLSFSRVVPPQARQLYLWVWVAPDQFYSGFFRSILRRGNNRPGAREIEIALKNSINSQYRLFGRKIPIRPHNRTQQ